MLLRGKEIADQLLSSYLKRAKRLPRPPKLVVILVGENAASKAYIKMKEQACQQVGILSPLIALAQSTSEKQLLKHIDALNADLEVDGILVQLPLPAHINPTVVMQRIAPEKDVDGFHPVNMGKLLLGDPSGFIPCTPLGIQTLLREAHISTEGKHVVIVGRSNIVGKPLAALLIQKTKAANATVTLAHSQTTHLPSLTQRADILVAAMGKPRFIQAQHIKEGAVVIDVGISREKEGLVGDVDFDQVAPKCQAITPVPGGVGPMTVAMLVENTLLSCERRCG